MAGKKQTKKTYQPTKSKGAAIFIAVFFGIFSWVYTYKTDAWKFWLNLVLSIATFGVGGVIAWIWVIIDQAIKPNEYFEDYYKF